MSWDTVLKYDAGVTGGSPTFTRNVEAPDESGTLQSANTRRFASRDRWIGGAVVWDEELDLGTNVSILGSGPDQDGTPLFVVKNASAGTVQIYSLSVAGVATLESTTAVSALPTASGSRVFNVGGACVYHGLIVLTCQRTVSSTIEGITLFASQDQGATWASIDHDTGGTDIPQIASSPTLNSVAREWSRCQAFPSGGMDADGNYNLLEAFFIGTDYCGRGTPEPQGGQAFLFRATRHDTSTDWTIEDTRLIYEQWLTMLSGAGSHAHTAWVADPANNQGIIVALGDSSSNNRMDYVALDLDNYLTDTPVLTQSWYGGYSSTTESAKVSPQPVSAVPGRGYTTLASGDETFGVVYTIDAAPSSSSTPSLTEACRQIQNTLASINWNGPSPLWLGWYPGGGYASGNEDFSDWGSSLDPTKHYSPDGINWIQIPGVEDYIDSVLCVCGQKLIGRRTSDEMLMVADPPTYIACKPLLLAPGAANKMTEFTQRTAPSSGNSNVAVQWTSEDGYTYVSDDSPVPNAPTLPPPDPNGFLREITVVNTTAYGAGNWWYQASGQTIDGTSNVCCPAWVHSLDRKSAVTISNVLGVEGDYYNEERAFGWADTGNWSPCPTQTLIGTEARGHLDINVGRSGTQTSQATFLVCYGGMYVSDEMPYPVSSGAGSNPDELETLTSLTSSSEWSVAYSGLMAWMSTAEDRTLMTAYQDSSNFVEVTWDESTTTLSFTPTVSGSPETAIDIVMDDWVHGWPLSFVLSDDGTNLEATVLSPRSGLQSGTTANSIGGSPATLKLSNSDGTVVSAQEVGLLAYDTRYHGQAVREQLLTDFDFTTTDITTRLYSHLPCQDNAEDQVIADSINAAGSVAGTGDTTDLSVPGPGGSFPLALRTNGTDNIISSAALTVPTYPISMGCWINNEVDAAQSFMALASTAGLTSFLSVMTHANDNFWTERRNTSYVGTLLGLSTQPLDAWKHVGLVFTATDISLFVNGVFVATKTATSVPITGMDRFVLGSGRYSTGYQFFEGAVCDGRLYSNRALVAAEWAAIVELGSTKVAVFQNNYRLKRG